MEENVIAKLSSTPPPRKWKYTVNEATARLADLETLCGVAPTVTPIGNIGFLHSRIAMLEPIAAKMSKLTTAKVFSDAKVTLPANPTPAHTPTPPKAATTAQAVSALSRKEFDALPKDWQAEHLAFGGIVADPVPQVAAAAKPMEKITTTMTRHEFDKLKPREQSVFCRSGGKIRN